MNNEELLCSALDNTLIQQAGKSVNNSNTYQASVPEYSGPYLGQTIDKDDLLEESDEIVSRRTNIEEVMTGSYEAISLYEELRNCQEIGGDTEEKSKITAECPKSVSSPKRKQKSLKKDSGSSFKALSVSEDNNIHDFVIKDCQEDIEEDVMSGSYGEISLDRDLISSNKNSDSQSSKEDLKINPSDENTSDSLNEEVVKERKRPDSLVLTHNLLACQNEDFDSLSKDGAYVQQMHKSQQTSECRTSEEVSPSLSSEEFALHSMGLARSGSDTSGLSELQGTLTVDGDLVTFVAEDLQEKIKMSSPVSRVTDSSSFPGSRSSTPSLYRQALQPQFHIVDPHVISDLESHAKKVATVVDTMLENLSETLQSFSSLTLACMETYENSVCKTCDAVDANIKSVYQLMAKCEELSNSMQPLYKISGDIKHIKKMLDQLEHAVEHKS